MTNLDTFQSIDLTSLSTVTGGAPNGPGPNPEPAKQGINEPTYKYWGGEAGRAAGEMLGSETAAKHLQSAGQAAGQGIYRAGTWLGQQAARLTGN